MAKFISDSQIIGERGRHLVSERILAVGLSFHPTGALDAGIDGFLELRDLETGEVRAQFVPAQIKTQAEGPFPRETVTGFTYIPKSRDLDYWLQANVPIILIVARLSDGLIVWKSVQEWFAAPEHRVSRSIEFDVRQDALTVEALPALAELVASFARPRLMVPPMRAPEELDLNLLKAVVPQRVNIATTERSYGEIADLLGQGGRRRPVDWILQDGLLPRDPVHYVSKHLQQGIESDHFRVKRPMPRVGCLQSFYTARRTIQGFEAMLWLRKGFGFAGAWTVCEQNQLLALCFGLPEVNKV